jgi:hypothetical protein
MKIKTEQHTTRIMTNANQQVNEVIMETLTQ